MSEANRTTDHEEIRRWVEERGGKPATVTATKGDEDAGLLRIDFPEAEADDALEEISWDAFFEKFDEAGLAFLYQEETKDGETSRFHKFVRKEADE